MDTIGIVFLIILLIPIISLIGFLISLIFVYKQENGPSEGFWREIFWIMRGNKTDSNDTFTDNRRDDDDKWKF